MNLPPRLAAALARRAPLAAQPDTDAYRLLNRAGDGLPDLAVDRFADVLVAHLYSEGVKVKPPLNVLRPLAEKLNARAVYVKYRPAQASRLSEEERRKLAPAGPAIGERVAEVIVHENGSRFLVRPGEGLSVGLFLDMREQRAWVRANARGKTVLNCFAYTCGFGIAALKGGAARAVNLDIAKPYLEWGKRNAELNGFAPGPKDFIAGDVFDWLRRFGRLGQTFDLVIVDPPSFSTTRLKRFSIQSDYAELIAYAIKAVAPGGWLLACANSAEMPLKSFKAKVREGLADHPARIVRMMHEPEVDFPVGPGAAAYLKVCLVQRSS